MYFHARRSEVGQWAVVHVTGEIDLATGPKFRSVLLSAVRDASAVAVDLSDCDLIDSVGLGVIIGGARRCREAGQPFVVVADGSVRALFTRCRLDEILVVVPSLELLPSVVSETGAHQ